MCLLLLIIHMKNILIIILWIHPSIRYIDLSNCITIAHLPKNEKGQKCYCMQLKRYPLKSGSLLITVFEFSLSTGISFFQSSLQEYGRSLCCGITILPSSGRFQQHIYEGLKALGIIFPIFP